MEPTNKEKVWTYVTEGGLPKHGGQVLISWTFKNDISGSGPFVGQARWEKAYGWTNSKGSINHLDIYAWTDLPRAASRLPVAPPGTDESAILGKQAGRQFEDARDPGLEVEVLVTRFANALRKKLIASEEKYGWHNGWMRDDWQNDLRTQLLSHIEKGDPTDVAAYCAFAWHHGWSVAEPSPAQPPEEISPFLHIQWDGPSRSVESAHPPAVCGTCDKPIVPCRASTCDWQHITLDISHPAQPPAPPVQLAWEYRGEGLYIYWSNPFNGGNKEDLVMFMWPSHAPEATDEVEKTYEGFAAHFVREWNRPAEPSQPVGSDYRIDDCKNCGRMRVEKNGVCEKCGFNNDVHELRDPCAMTDEQYESYIYGQIEPRRDQRKTYKNGYWICRCGVVAMPLMDDTSCDCSDIYEQDWNFIEIAKPVGDSDESWEASEALCAVESQPSSAQGEPERCNYCGESVIQIGGGRWRHVDRDFYAKGFPHTADPRLEPSQPSSADLVTARNQCQGIAKMHGRPGSNWCCQLRGGHEGDCKFHDPTAKRTEGAQVELPDWGDLKEPIDGAYRVTVLKRFRWYAEQLQAALSREAALKKELQSFWNHWRAVENVLGHKPTSARSLASTAQKLIDELAAKDASHKITLDREAATTARYDARLDELEFEKKQVERSRDAHFANSVGILSQMEVHREARYNAEADLQSLREREQRDREFMQQNAKDIKAILGEALYPGQKIGNIYVHLRQAMIYVELQLKRAILTPKETV